jgi:hypothetical protein
MPNVVQQIIAEASKKIDASVSFVPSELDLPRSSPHGWRRGLYSCAASRLGHSKTSRIVDFRRPGWRPGYVIRSEP